MRSRWPWLALVIAFALMGLWTTMRSAADVSTVRARESTGCGSGSRRPKVKSKDLYVRRVDPEPKGEVTSVAIGDRGEGLVVAPPEDPPPVAKDTAEPPVVHHATVADPSILNAGQPNTHAEKPLELTLAPGGQSLAWLQGGSLFVGALTATTLVTLDELPLAGTARHLTWSPGGDLVFEMNGRLYGWKSGVKAVYPLISEGVQPGVLTEPVFSPRGDWLAFVTDSHGNGDVQVYFPASDTLRRVHVTPLSESRLSVSPEGTQVAYARGSHELVLTELPSETEHNGLLSTGRIEHTAFLAGGSLLWVASGDGMVLRRVDPGGARRTLHRWTAGPVLDRLTVTPDSKWVVVPSEPEAWTGGTLTLQSVDGPAQIAVDTSVSSPESAHFARRGERVLMAWTGEQEQGWVLFLADVTDLLASE